MPQYLVAIYLPDDFDPSVKNEAEGARCRRAQRGAGR
jgi:hypothetical protein